MQVKNAKPKEKQYKLADGGGMYLLVLPAGGKYWRLKYRIRGKEKVLALGVYPEVDLEGARDKRYKAKQLIKSGVDPLAKQKVEKIQKKLNEENTFEAISREWHEKQLEVLAPITARDTLSKLVNHVFPYIGYLVINEISVPDVLAVLRRLESAGKISAAHRTKQIIGRVFRYAIASGRAMHDPAADLKGALTPEKTTHHASITDPKQIGDLLRAIDGYTGTFIVKCALQLAPLLFVRPGELRRAEWKDIDFKAAQWVVPRETMKKAGEERREHIVPLSTQAVAILKELYKLTGNERRKANGKRRYVFSKNDKPMSENTVNQALKRLGYSGKVIVGHGFRTTASTLLHENDWLSDAVERQLSHVETNEVKRAYNKAKHLDIRVKMMQAWSDYLYELKADIDGNKVVKLRKA